ncbi:hypothetical protein RSAG8_12860, partial [Rhizoctonia solani AG-8 WAC10335]
MTHIGDIEDALDVIQERLDKQAHSGYTTDNNQSSPQNTAKPYGIGQTDRTDNAINIPLWVHSHGSNPAVKLFITSLKQHLLLGITDGSDMSGIGKVTFQMDQMFSHAINYMSYDVCCQHDTINPKSPC